MRRNCLGIESRAGLPFVRQRGVTIVAAIFLLMLLGGIGALMLTLTSTQNITSAQDIQGVRAYQAARLGMEWGVYRVMNPENLTAAGPITPEYACTGSPTTLNTASNAAVFSGALTGFSVTVACAFVANSEGTNRIRTYTITSTASFGGIGSLAAVERQISTSVLTCRQSLNGPIC